ncbi:CoA transferase [Agreia pratensis]|uniref:CoA transferase n=1 Tax=Agreia pratensis TaxID=150121 RepID=UPI00188A98A7|nr:CoA transferase [Agreia pratensis]MBF4634484.1 CoA transferase [Agreia pratensis]
MTRFESLAHTDDPLVGMPDMARLRRLLPSNLDVAGLASRSVADFVGSVNEYLVASGGSPRNWALDADRIAAAYGSDRLLRLHGEPVQMFAELSGFFRTRDGWIRTHANYPHHRLGLCLATGLDDTATAADFAARVATLDARAIEEAAWRVGALAVRVREPAEWEPPAGVVHDETLGASRATPRRPPSESDPPLAGIRVLDLTRVIAGPVATRSLALLGADVLRVDPPAMPEIALQHVDTGQGKRSTFIDGASLSGRATLDVLLAEADVLVSGYRPGAIEALGLKLPPGIVHATVNAWGDVDTWSERRGFDSLVQAVTGISRMESQPSESDDPRPGALPVQALDHSAGYRLAAAVVRALGSQFESPVGHRVSVSLAGVAAELLAGDHVTRSTERIPLPDSLVVTHGEYTTARPALAEFADYAFPAHPLGADPATWE